MAEKVWIIILAAVLAFLAMILIVIMFIGYNITPADTTRLNESPGNVSEYCREIYDQIDTDLRNANYCQTDDDCETLPLAGPYIEFGCYHYINKNEDRDDFYRRMNKYSAECSGIIDMCAPIPESRCSEGICVKRE